LQAKVELASEEVKANLAVVAVVLAVGSPEIVELEIVVSGGAASIAVVTAVACPTVGVLDAFEPRERGRGAATRWRSPTDGRSFETARHTEPSPALLADPEQRVTALRSDEPDHAWTEEEPAPAISSSSAAGPMILLDILRISSDRNLSPSRLSDCDCQSASTGWNPKTNAGRLFGYPRPECRNKPLNSYLHRLQRPQVATELVRIWSLSMTKARSGAAVAPR
jgi:hypothetical protein